MHRLRSDEVFHFDNDSAPNSQQAQPALKQVMCKHMIDAHGCKDGNAGEVKMKNFSTSQSNFIIAGIGTEVGKTVTAAIVTCLVEGDYWKPVQSGEETDSDTATMQRLIGSNTHKVHPPAYSLKAPLSPHHAARLEGVVITKEKILLPSVKCPLVIEMAAGIYTPLAPNLLNIDLFTQWPGTWIVVSRHYLGSINHTLLTLQAIKQHGISPAGLIFNGVPNADTESAILEASQIPLLGRLLPEPVINSKTIKKYKEQWKSNFTQLIL